MLFSIIRPFVNFLRSKQRLLYSLYSIKTRQGTLLKDDDYMLRVTADPYFEGEDTNPACPCIGVTTYT